VGGGERGERERRKESVEREIKKRKVKRFSPFSTLIHPFFFFFLNFSAISSQYLFRNTLSITSNSQKPPKIPNKKTERVKQDNTYQSKRSMSSHTMSHDTHSLGIDLLKPCKDSLRQLARDVAVHVIRLGPRGAGGIDIKAGTNAEVVVVVFAGNV
jgi:hypothetical protein